MKTVKTSKILNVVLLICTLAFSGCSNSDDGNGDGQTPSDGSSYLTYSLLGTGILDATNITISNQDDTENAAILIFGHVYFDETDLGTEKLVSLSYGYIGSNGEVERSVEMTFSAGTGSKVLGEFETGSTGLITFHPTEYMIVSVDDEDIFYDNDNDQDNDASNNLLSKNIVVSITEYEETTNELGILTLKHIKGTIGNSGNQLFSNYFTSPTTDPGELLYNITADFEYNRIVQ
ncbi:MAG: hypothetical protein GYB32_11960 [Algicola sp.]|nr:hypothetical protein [Algicola sp.]